MDIIIIPLVALFASVLTFFSGFGLGTILAPVFAIFFPVDVAIAMTGIVHFTNNIFKIVLIGKFTDKIVLLKFGIPALIMSFLGAWLLIQITVMPSVFQYQIGGEIFDITPVKLIVAIILLIFSFLEIIPSVQKIQFGKDKLFIGGILSGFFGGLTGTQGAIRSAFLIKSGLSKEAYVATGVFIACLVDISRLSVYASRFSEANLQDNIGLLIYATMAAITGAVIGRKLLKKVTLRVVQIIVAVMLICISIALGTGII
ncbi:MAG: hypothetical protein A2275_10150 [Bacteroidetes bacterium RIFOXYA12_FULL_35_11]|nr:MAG: hypothetical protein A2X01_07500 [Bacteroidetes bacterium GWF2_35_48]OFY73701.1 MAG: hypothetical protein A2275_10150 [Bacteroidetes bacterium RIFOXYA12_FULL_35_11]OFY92789.1 MAG: hypothetical protein A2491_05815 [Bacteroidetes bacterium RIFOXYC12_FULL_35_7]OFY96658.1 MAG: hypothetical protein A2309_05690 [Bacteroidetes bacterium RIFOXYB2_FULL_35_7]OGX57002.1 MAG: hypothetical protein A2447_02505 [Omnitrophica WOR_2 bacterium RIFOXYC2_FULL_38_12]HBX52899.1 hypothetical protein [Bactero